MVGVSNLIIGAMSALKSEVFMVKLLVRVWLKFFLG
jgi:hypothetical protein